VTQRVWGYVLYPGTSGGACRSLVCRVSCVVVAGAGRSGLLLWVGVLCDVAARVGQCEHGGGVRERHTSWVSPVVCSTPVVSYMPHMPRMRGKGWGDDSTLFGPFGTCQTTRS
jgi:hypothetical protein